MDAISLHAAMIDAPGNPNDQAPGTFLSYREIDLYDDEPIKFNKSIQSIEEPTATTSNFTRTFRVPANSGNGQYFKAVFNVNSTDFDATKKADAYININNAYFVGGNIRLTAIYTNGERSKVEYEIVFMGETSTFASVVAPKNMSEINLNALGHNFTYENVKLSWNAGPGSTGGLLNGDVVYPLCEWGYTYGDDNQPEQATLSVYTGTTGGSMKGFTNSLYPLLLTQFKPIVRAKRIWDAIFDDAGYTYESQFLDSMFFKNLYMVSTDVATSNAELVYTPYAIIGIPYSGPTTLAFDNFTKVVANNEYEDNTNSFNPVNSTYTIPFTGYYTITSRLKMTFTPNNFIGYTNFSYAMYKNGVQAVSRSGSLLTPGFSTYTENASSVFPQPYATPPVDPEYDFDFSGNYTQGDVIEFYIYVPSYQFNYLIFQVGSIKFTGPAVIMPQGLMPTQYKQIDFIKGVNDRFKLMWQPDKENEKNFKIEPWVDWVKQGQQLDWSDKLNEELDVTIKPLFYTQPRRVIFKDSEEADVFNFSYQQQNKQVFGQLNQDSNIELITGDRVITSMFAPVPLAPIAGTGGFLIPHFAKDTETQRQPMQVKPRLVFYNGEQSVPPGLQYYMKDTPGGTGPSAIQQATYPLISQFNIYPFDQASYDLNWTNNPQFWDPLNNIYPPAGGSGATGFAGRTTNTTYVKYWEAWFDSTYNPYSRIMEATFALDSTDIYNLEFNDIIMVKDSWWSVTKITDYVLGTKQNVKVQLVKLGDIGISIGVTGPTSITGTILTEFKGICFGLTQCDAYCCRGITSFSVYANNKILYNAQFIYGNPSGSIPAPAGWYWDGNFTMQVNEFGVITAFGTGAGCVCVPPLFAISVCPSDDFCTACCCTSYTQTIYGDNANLALCTVLYGDNVGTTTLIPNNYYKNASTQCRVGANGITITSFGICDFCNCGYNPNSKVLARSATTEGGTGGTGPGPITYGTAASACSNTGSQSYETFYISDPLFVDSSTFYYDVNSVVGIGDLGQVGVTGFVSDGEFVKYYEGATASGSTLDCADLTPIDRTNPITFRAISYTGADLTATFGYYTLPDPATFLYIDQAIYTGTNWDQTHVIDYNTSNFTAVKLLVDVPTVVVYQYYQEGIVIDYQKMALEPGQVYLFQSRLPVENYAIEVYFTFLY